MKKSLIVLIIALTFSVTSEISAQCKYGPRLSLGLSSLGSGGSSIGYQAGVFINAELKDRIGIQGEVLYSIKNGHSDYTVPGLNNTVLERSTRYRFSYIDIPVYGYVPLSQHITFLAGFQFGVLNGATYRVTGSGVTTTEGRRQNVQEIETRMGIAAGLDFNMASPVRFGLRFSTNGGGAFRGRSSFVAATMAYYMDW